MHLQINVGDEAQDYKHIQTKERLTELQVEIRKLLDKADKIKKEQDYQRVSLDVCNLNKNECQIL